MIAHLNLTFLDLSRYFSLETISMRLMGGRGDILSWPFILFMLGRCNLYMCTSFVCCCLMCDCNQFCLGEVGFCFCCSPQLVVCGAGTGSLGYSLGWAGKQAV